VVAHVSHVHAPSWPCLHQPAAYSKIRTEDTHKPALQQRNAASPSPLRSRIGLHAGAAAGGCQPLPPSLPCAGGCDRVCGLISLQIPILTNFRRGSAAQQTTGWGRHWAPCGLRARIGASFPPPRRPQPPLGGPQMHRTDLQHACEHGRPVGIDFGAVGAAGGAVAGHVCRQVGWLQMGSRSDRPRRRKSRKLGLHAFNMYGQHTRAARFPGECQKHNVLIIPRLNSMAINSPPGIARKGGRQPDKYS
jgi:hypothetical protein